MKCEVHIMHDEKRESRIIFSWKSAIIVTSPSGFVIITSVRTGESAVLASGTLKSEY